MVERITYTSKDRLEMLANEVLRLQQLEGELGCGETANWILEKQEALWEEITAEIEKDEVNRQKNSPLIK